MSGLISPAIFDPSLSRDEAWVGKYPRDLGHLVGGLGGRLAPQTAYPAPMANRAFCRQAPKVGA